jgi:hypothetical protein
MFGNIFMKRNYQRQYRSLLSWVSAQLTAMMIVAILMMVA